MEPNTATTETEPKEKPPTPQPEAKAEEQPTYVFPDTTSGHIFHFDNAHHTAWIGIRLVGFDWENIKLWIDHCKFMLYDIWRQYAIELQRQNQLAEQMKRGGMTPEQIAAAKRGNDNFIRKIFKH